jgi:hypothetical protein
MLKYPLFGFCGLSAKILAESTKSCMNIEKSKDREPKN